MIAEGIAGGPVGDILTDPAGKGLEILRGVLFMQVFRPAAGNEELFQAAGFKKSLTKGKNLRLVFFFYRFEVLGGDFSDQGGFHAVKFDFFFEEFPTGISGFFTAILTEFFAE